MNEKSSLKLNNRGLSLVELLVALGVSLIVLTMLSALIFYVLKASGRTNANVLVQNESQTTTNLITDEIMDSTGLILEDSRPGDPDAMRAVLLGTLTVNTGVAVPTGSFIGDAIVYNPSWDPDDPAAQERKLYLITFPETAPLSVTGFSPLSAPSGASLRDRTEAGAAKKALELVKEKFGDTPGAGYLDRNARLVYLMGEHVTGFYLYAGRDVSGTYEPVNGNIFPDKNTKYVDPTDPLEADGVTPKTAERYYYTEPLTLSLEMDFAYEYGGASPAERHVKDAVTIRNRSDAIYYDNGSGMIKYYLQSKNR
ncbi:MAG: prepilin-type N-terminal cleavage/methylation domain-containing protein [Lachnospiraceae bacterium]|nr:prepilin-type N-terminal cleavage/methylation domain-containing protein [Lachnospiraceae bacterium]